MWAKYSRCRCWSRTSWVHGRHRQVLWSLCSWTFSPRCPPSLHSCPLPSLFPHTYYPCCLNALVIAFHTKNQTSKMQIPVSIKSRDKSGFFVFWGFFLVKNRPCTDHLIWALEKQESGRRLLWRNWRLQYKFKQILRLWLTELTVKGLGLLPCISCWKGFPQRTNDRCLATLSVSLNWIMAIFIMYGSFYSDE